MQEYGKEVYIIAENPQLPAEPRSYISRLFAHRKFPDVRLGDVMKRQEKYLRILSEITNATTIGVAGTMCPNGKCLAFTEDGLPMYWDDNHLSYIGSEFQAERILNPYLNSK